MNRLFQKFCLLIILSVFAFQPFLAFAQVPIPTITAEIPGSPLSIAAIATASEAAAIAVSTGLIASGVGNPLTVAASGLITGTAEGVCSAVDAQNSDPISSVLNTTLDNASFIGEGAGEVTSITRQIAELEALRFCRKQQLQALKAIPITNLLMGQDLQRKQGVISTELNSIDQRIERLRERNSAAGKNILKAIALKALLTFSKTLTTKLVNGLIAKYRINNYLYYADAVASQVYTVDHINKNYSGDKQQQFILKSVLDNSIGDTPVLPMVKLKAEENLGFNPDELAFTDPDYYIKLSTVGKTETNPYYLQTAAYVQAQESKGRGMQEAKSEIDSGNGFIPTRQCTNATADQKQIDQQNIQLSKEVYDNEIISKQLLIQYTKNPTPENKAEMEKAAAALGASKKKLRDLPVQTEKPIISMCEGITNPAGFMAGGIQNLLKKHLDEAANIKTENMPFWANFISSVADNLITNIFEGGRGNLTMLRESGFQASNILANDLAREASTPDIVKLQGGNSSTPGGNVQQKPATTPSGVPITWVGNIGTDATGDRWTVNSNGILINYVEPAANGSNKPTVTPYGVPISWEGNIGTDATGAQWTVDLAGNLIPYAGSGQVFGLITRGETPSAVKLPIKLR